MIFLSNGSKYAFEIGGIQTSMQNSIMRSKFSNLDMPVLGDNAYNIPISILLEPDGMIIQRGEDYEKQDLLHISSESERIIIRKNNQSLISSSKISIIKEECNSIIKALEGNSVLLVNKDCLPNLLSNQFLKKYVIFMLSLFNRLGKTENYQYLEKPTGISIDYKSSDKLKTYSYGSTLGFHLELITTNFNFRIFYGYGPVTHFIDNETNKDKSLYGLKKKIHQPLFNEGNFKLINSDEQIKYKIEKYVSIHKNEPRTIGSYDIVIDLLRGLGIKPSTINDSNIRQLNNGNILINGNLYAHNFCFDSLCVKYIFNNDRLLLTPKHFIVDRSWEKLLAILDSMGSTKLLTKVIKGIKRSYTYRGVEGYEIDENLTLKISEYISRIQGSKNKLFKYYRNEENISAYSNKSIILVFPLGQTKNKDRRFTKYQLKIGAKLSEGFEIDNATLSRANSREINFKDLGGDSYFLCVDSLDSKVLAEKPILVNDSIRSGIITPYLRDSNTGNYIADSNNNFIRELYVNAGFSTKRRKIKPESKTTKEIIGVINPNDLQHMEAIGLSLDDSKESILYEPELKNKEHDNFWLKLTELDNKLEGFEISPGIHYGSGWKSYDFNFNPSTRVLSVEIRDKSRSFRDTSERIHEKTALSNFFINADIGSNYRFEVLTSSYRNLNGANIICDFKLGEKVKIIRSHYLSCTIDKIDQICLFGPSGPTNLYHALVSNNSSYLNKGVVIPLHKYILDNCTKIIFSEENKVYTKSELLNKLKDYYNLTIGLEEQTIGSAVTSNPINLTKAARLYNSSAYNDLIINSDKSIRQYATTTNSFLNFFSSHFI